MLSGKVKAQVVTVPTKDIDARNHSDRKVISGPLETGRWRNYKFGLRRVAKLEAVTARARRTAYVEVGRSRRTFAWRNPCRADDEVPGEAVHQLARGERNPSCWGALRQGAG